MSAALAALLIVAACGTTPAGHKHRTAKVTPRPSATATPGATPAAPLASPILVQIENSGDARPQSGLSGADVLYEYDTEGGITRFTALFSAPQSIGNIGPVRSARPVTVLLTQIYKAALLYSGAATLVLNEISAAHITTFSEGSFNDTFRIDSRAAPHNLYTNGGDLNDLLAHAAMPAASYQLWPRTSSITGGSPAVSMTVPLSPAENPVFSWNASSRAYTRTEADTGPFTDADTGQPVQFANVVVMPVPVTSAGYTDVNGVSALAYTLQGSGAGQLFTGGQQFAITWSQGASGPPQFTVGSSPAPMSPGLVLICLVPPGTTATYSAG